MNHYDKQILEAQREEDRRKHTTLETGNVLPVQLEEGGKGVMSSQFQEALRNVNSSICINEGVDNMATYKGNQWKDIADQCSRSVEEAWGGI
jgi:hypothetical protein